MSEDSGNGAHRAERTDATALEIKIGLAEMLKGGVIMDVTTPDQARIAEEAGAAAVMALERVPSDIRKEGGVARMCAIEIIEGIRATVSIPVMDIDGDSLPDFDGGNIAFTGHALGGIIGTAFTAIEPMVNAGAPEVVLSAEDGWTARTRDGSRSAHFEACVAVTEDGPWILGRQARPGAVQQA